MNFADKYAPMIDERFRLGALTNPGVNHEYDFTGVKTVEVYSLPTVDMRDYERSGQNRYGAPTELEGGVQELTLSRDRAFTFTLDRASLEKTEVTTQAGLALSRQIDEVVIPEIDTYRLRVMAEGATMKRTAEITAQNAYEALLDATAALSNQKVPVSGRVCFVSPRFYKLLQQDAGFLRGADSTKGIAHTGQVGFVDGVAIILAPQSYLPSGVGFLLVHPSAVCGPVKLSDYKVHDNPPGINGQLVEGRVVYDAFVLSQKTGGLFVHSVPLYEVTFTITAGGSAAAGAVVSAGGQSAVTDASGKATIMLPTGVYPFTAAKDGFLPKGGSVTVAGGEAEASAALEG